MYTGVYGNGDDYEDDYKISWKSYFHTKDGKTSLDLSYERGGPIKTVGMDDQQRGILF